MMIDPLFWKGKRVFVTGHTGFKGSWLCLWLSTLGAEVTGYALEPPTNPNLFDLCRIGELIHSQIADIRNRDVLFQSLANADPEIIIHLAAQSQVLDSYSRDVETYEINTMGTVHLFEAVRKLSEFRPAQRVVINVTTDKCYENEESIWGYRETDRLGGYDPYATSKACSELISSSYRNAFFNPAQFCHHHIVVASARSGNVIGGGDFATNRLIPNCIQSYFQGESIKIRHPQAVRPWQHVLEPLHGYLTLAEQSFRRGPAFAEAWNFGPDEYDAKSVVSLVQSFFSQLGIGRPIDIVEQSSQLHEANSLRLDCSKAKQRLRWFPCWNLTTAIGRTAEWFQAYQAERDMREVCSRQIEDFQIDLVKSGGECD